MPPLPATHLRILRKSVGKNAFVCFTGFFEFRAIFLPKTALDPKIRGKNVFEKLTELLDLHICVIVCDVIKALSVKSFSMRH